MTWFRVDDSFADHVKLDGLEGDALIAVAGAWMLCGADSAHRRTDGAVSRTRLARVLGNGRAVRRAVEELVARGLWEETEDGWQFHDWADYQPTATELRRAADSHAERQRVYREKRASRDEARSAMRDASRDEARVASSDACSDDTPVPIPSRPDPDRSFRAPARVTPEPKDQGPEPEVRADRQKPKRQRPSKPVTSPLPPDWAPSAALVAWGESNAAVRLDRDRVAEEAEKFADHHRTKASAFADWDAAFRTWLRNARKFDPSAPEPRRRASGEVRVLPPISAESQARADRLLAQAGGDKGKAIELALAEMGAA